ncbi:MAG: YbaB/EbfC family nucleoid-associated protein [Rhodothalassiaceae bacterium]
MNIGKMMKQAQEMQAKMAEMQESLGAMEITGEAGAGMVKVTLTGKGALKAVKIDPSLFSEEEAEVVEDLIVAAHADAKARTDEKMQDEMKKLTGGLGLPPGLKLPF